MNSDLFTGQLVRLVAPDGERDADLWAKWSRVSDIRRLADDEPIRVYNAKESKEWLDNGGHGPHFFMIRTMSDDCLIGSIGLGGLNWASREAWVGVEIVERDYLGKGYGTDAMRVMLRYAFDELNLQRVSLAAFENNQRALRSYQKVGFTIEGCMRGEVSRDGRRWNSIFMGLLRDEWWAMNNEQ